VPFLVQPGSYRAGTQAGGVQLADSSYRGLTVGLRNGVAFAPCACASLAVPVGADTLPPGGSLGLATVAQPLRDHLAFDFGKDPDDLPHGGPERVVGIVLQAEEDLRLRKAAEARVTKALKSAKRSAALAVEEPVADPPPVDEVDAFSAAMGGAQPAEVQAQQAVAAAAERSAGEKSVEQNLRFPGSE
jgi:hypothetical protein